MIKQLRSAALTLILCASTTLAQDLNAYMEQSIQQNQAIMDQYMQQGQALAGQMQQGQNNIVNSNMQNPEVQAAYIQYRNSGGTDDFQTFAYNYAATGGFSQRGMDIYNQSERGIQQRENAAIQDYRAGQAANAQALQQMHERNSEIARQRGNLLNGTTDYTDPNSGAQFNLPHTIQPDSYYRDYGSGETFYNDPQGNYYRDNGNGWMNQIDPND